MLAFADELRSRGAGLRVLEHGRGDGDTAIHATGNDGSVAQNYQGGVIHWSPSGSYSTWV